MYEFKYPSGQQIVRQRSPSFVMKIFPVAIILALTSGAFMFGNYFGNNKFDTEKYNLVKENDSLNRQIDVFHAILLRDSAGFYNYKDAYAHNYLFNHDSIDIPVILISNPRFGENTAGVHISGAWKEQATVQKGDDLAVAIFYKNSGVTTVENVSVACQLEIPPDDRTIVCKGYIFAGNQIIRVGTAVAYKNKGEKFVYKQDHTYWLPNWSTTKVSVIDSSIKNGIVKVGDIGPGNSTQGIVIRHFTIL